VLRDAEGNVHTIPNSAIAVAINKTASLNRIHVLIEVPFRECDRATQLADEVGAEVADAHGTEMLSTPAVVGQAMVRESEVRLQMVADARQQSRWLVESDLRRRLKRRFDAEKLEATFVDGEKA
jgi:small-conductance mechanosensitive channel